MQIILASQSPRRKFVLTEMGLDFQAIPSNFDEYFDEKRSVDEVAKELAIGKALDVARQNPEAIVIGADTIVVLDDRQLGKPENAGVAKVMLKAYRNRSNQVISAVAVVCYSQDYAKVATDVVNVFFDGLPDEVIDEYVASGNPKDKAGAYAIQHPLIRPHVRDIQGRLDTIIGLPTNKLAEFLQDFGITAKPLDMNDEKLVRSIGFYE